MQQRYLSIYKMLRKIFTGITAILIVLCALPVSAQDWREEYNARRNKFLQDLSSSSTYPDSLRILYNIYDIAVTPSDRAASLDSLLDVSLRHHDNNVVLDVLTHQFNVHQRNPEKLQLLKPVLDSVPDSPQKKEAALFLDIIQFENIVNLDSGNAYAALDSILSASTASEPADAYENIRQLCAVCKLLSGVTEGELLEEYYDKLIKQIEVTPLATGSIRNLVYTRASPVYTNNRNYTKAIQTDRKMLNVIDSLAESYAEKGRPYRTLSANRYKCLSRMLGNYKGLNDGEIQLYYKQIQHLAQQDPRVKADIAEFERPYIFYSLATGNYKDAIDAIKRQIDKPRNQIFRSYMLNALYEAADSIDDRATMLSSSREYIRMLKAYIDNQAQERARELDVVYDIKRLEADNAALLKANDDVQRKHMYIFLVCLCVILALLIVLIIVLMMKNKRIRQLSERQYDISSRLRRERNELKDAQAGLIAAREEASAANKAKTEFVNNMSHEMQTPLNAIVEYSRLIVDCIPEERRKYLSRFGSVIEFNSKLLMKVLSDVLDIAAIEQGVMVIDKRTTTAEQICSMAVQNIFEENRHDAESLQFVFNGLKDVDIPVNTDLERAVQVLMNLLGNARKFTEKGTVQFDVERTEEQVRFIVTDTGIGIPEELEEKIFERFFRVDVSKPGLGLGLYIARNLAEALGGKLYLDGSYRAGARFVFILPLG